MESGGSSGMRMTRNAPFSIHSKATCMTTFLKGSPRNDASESSAFQVPDKTWSGRSAEFRMRSLVAGMRFFQFGDIELGHLHHRFHGAAGLCAVRVAEDFSEDRRNDLPGDAISIGEPAASVGPSAFGKFIPVMIDFLLGFAVDEEGGRAGELPIGVHRSAVEENKFPPFDRDRQPHRLAVHARHAAYDLRMGEYGSIKVRGLFRIAVREPQECLNFVHECLLVFCVALLLLCCLIFCVV